ncbi:unnamed protein product [Cuscuta epithymum]|uniref:Uncharacterized protein n=1 Tax=Cuscuta epithymum TaxID=186058 RepID=A0AAV0DGU1_9ASTE|nr:unnamed protein product [Cuscuta epithymum]CAH9145587.1 unnamed protein product [Cuscuta epithymum]
MTFILNTRNRNQGKYTNDYGTSEASLYLGDADAAPVLVANTTLGAFLQSPGSSNNLTLTFPAPAAVPSDTSNAIITMTAPFRFNNISDYGQLQVLCQLSYSSKLQGFDIPSKGSKCDVLITCWISRRGYKICRTSGA